MLSVKVKFCVVIAAIVSTSTVPACTGQTTASFDSSNSQEEIPQVTIPAKTSENTATANSPESMPGLVTPETNSDRPGKQEESSETVNNSKAPDRVDVVYFHRAQRCVTCLCFEERITYVVEAYFKNDLISGRLTYRVVNLGDKANKNLAIQYGAISSQLFVNSVENGTDHIEDIMDIWGWNCRGDKEGFDREVKNIIESRLKGET